MRLRRYFADSGCLAMSDQLLPVVAGEVSDEIASLERAREVLLHATLEDAQEVRSRAEAARVYAKRAKLASELQFRATEIRVRAERRLGELLSSMQRRGPGQYPRAEDQASEVAGFPTLDELGITRSQSSRWQQIASLSESLFDSYLGKVKGESRELTTSGLLRLARFVRAKKHASDAVVVPGDGIVTGSLDALVESGEQFGCIYADPPWPYENQATRAATGNHYPSMTLDDIASLRVAELAARDSHLHLWVTNGFLFEADYVMRSWGFEYRSTFVWVKPQIGLGNYWRCAHEFLLLGVRGKAPFRDRSLRSWIQEPRTKHSAKPEHIRTLVEKASPGPYLELFGRKKERGWSVWGNQVDQQEQLF